MQAPGWHLEQPLRAGGRTRFFPALHVLHDPGDDAYSPYEVWPEPTGRDYFVLPSGRLSPIEGNPFSKELRAMFVDVVGPWPRRAWARAVVRGVLYGSIDVRQLLEWNGREWEDGDIATNMVFDGFLEVAPWGPNAAVAVPFLYGEQEAHEGEGDWTEYCESGPHVPLGRAGIDVPTLLGGGCKFAAEAFAVSVVRDTFLAGRPRLGRSRPEAVTSWGPLEMRRWPAGKKTSERDDLEQILGFPPETIDSWEHRTLLVVSATDAYFAVMTPELRGKRDVLLLHFDGRTWTEVLRSPQPWAGMELAPDGSIWLVSGGRLHVLAPPGPGRGGFEAMEPGTLTVHGKDQPITPSQVMPWTARLASVVGSWEGGQGLFTVAR